MTRPYRPHTTVPITKPPEVRAAALDDAPWQTSALCAQSDPADWFPEKGGGQSAARAKATCRRCPVREECLADALKNDERYGIYGGLSERQRARLKKQMKETA